MEQIEKMLLKCLDNMHYKKLKIPRQTPQDDDYFENDWDVLSKEYESITDAGTGNVNALAAESPVDLKTQSLFISKVAINAIDIYTIEHTLYLINMEFRDPDSFYRRSPQRQAEQSLIFAILMVIRKTKCCRETFVEDAWKMKSVHSSVRKNPNPKYEMSSKSILINYAINYNLTATEGLDYVMDRYRQKEGEAVSQMRKLGMRSPGDLVSIIILGDNVVEFTNSKIFDRLKLAVAANMILCASYNNPEIVVKNPLVLACAAIEASIYMLSEMRDENKGFQKTTFIYNEIEEHISSCSSMTDMDKLVIEMVQETGRNAEFHSNLYEIAMCHLREICQKENQTP